MYLHLGVMATLLMLAPLSRIHETVLFPGWIS
jgi:hypothetical protein